MGISIDKALGIHQPALLLRAERAGLIAANLANSDTPNYKARDMDFRAELERAEGGRGALRTTHERHFEVGGSGLLAGEPAYRTADQPSIDGNTVDTQREKAAFMDNSMRYQASITFLDAKIRTLRDALRGDR